MAEGKYGSRWTAEETTLALELYFRTPFGRLHRLNKEVIDLANLMGRTPDALAMKLVNIAHIDPHQEVAWDKRHEQCEQAGPGTFYEVSLQS